MLMEPTVLICMYWWRPTNFRQFSQPTSRQNFKYSDLEFTKSICNLLHPQNNTQESTLFYVSGSGPWGPTHSWHKSADIRNSNTLSSLKDKRWNISKGTNFFGEPDQEITAVECMLEQILAKKEPHKPRDLHSFKTKGSRHLKSKTGISGFTKGSNVFQKNWQKL